MTDRLRWGYLLQFSIERSNKDALKNFACMILSTSFRKQFDSRERWFRFVACVRKIKNSESTFTDSKLTIFLILLFDFSFSISITSKVKIINVFSTVNQLSFQYFLGANLRGGSFRRFRNNLTITFNCLALHTKFWNPLLSCIVGDITNVAIDSETQNKKKKKQTTEGD